MNAKQRNKRDKSVTSVARSPMAPDASPKVRPRVTIETLNDKQASYEVSLQSSDCVICEGPAGVGKTFLAASVAAQALARKRIERVILSRANVSTGKSLGAFPGTVEEKMAPWLLPITDVLKKQLGEGFYKWACDSGRIQIQPLETIRGRSFDNSIIIMDEAQQLTKEELKAITTRIGTFSQLYLMGDGAQKDVKVDGLDWLKNLVKSYDLPVDVHTFTSDDIVRSSVCAAFVKAFEQEAKDNKE